MWDLRDTTSHGSDELHSRRKFLAGGATGLTVAFAGCGLLGGGNDGSSGSELAARVEVVENEFEGDLEYEPEEFSEEQVLGSEVVVLKHTVRNVADETIDASGGATFFDEEDVILDEVEPSRSRAASLEPGQAIRGGFETGAVTDPEDIDRVEVRIVEMSPRDL